MKIGNTVWNCLGQCDLSRPLAAAPGRWATRCSGENTPLHCWLEACTPQQANAAHEPTLMIYGLPFSGPTFHYVHRDAGAGRWGLHRWNLEGTRQDYEVQVSCPMAAEGSRVGYVGRYILSRQCSISRSSEIVSFLPARPIEPDTL